MQATFQEATSETQALVDAFLTLQIFGRWLDSGEWPPKTTRSSACETGEVLADTIPHQTQVEIEGAKAEPLAAQTVQGLDRQ
jgi:hypothetical protein